MDFIPLLKQFGEAAGLGSLELDASGECALLFDGEHEVNFTRDEEDRSVLLYSEVGDASRLDKAACLALLQASLLGAQSGGGALAVHPALDTVVLWKRHDDAFPDLLALEQAVNAFLAQAVHWKARLATAPEPLPYYDVMA